MSKWILPLVAALAMAIVIPSFAGAKSNKKHTCAIDAHALTAVVKTNSGNPPANGKQTVAGVVDGKLCGKTTHGALSAVVTYPQAGKFHTVAVTFGPLGSTKSAGDGTGTVHSNGTVSFSGSAKITGGTGTYKGATGSYTFTGSSSSVSSPQASYHITGTVKY